MYYSTHWNLTKFLHNIFSEEVLNLSSHCICSVRKLTQFSSVSFHIPIAVRIINLMGGNRPTAHLPNLTKWFVPEQTCHFIIFFELLKFDVLCWCDWWARHIWTGSMLHISEWICVWQNKLIHWSVQQQRITVTYRPTHALVGWLRRTFRPFPFSAQNAEI